MKITRQAFWLIITACAFLSAATSLRAQAQEQQIRNSSTEQAAAKQVSSPVSVPELIKALKSRNTEKREEAAEALKNLGLQAVPALSDFLKTDRSRARVYAASALLHIEPDNPAIVPALVAVIRQNNLFASTDELMERRGAAFLLTGNASGIQVLAEMLSDRDLFIRRSAAFAFEDFTEGTRYTKIPAIRDAFAKALPALVRALLDKDEIVNGVTSEALTQAGTTAIPALSEAAKSKDPNLSAAAKSFLESLQEM